MILKSDGSTEYTEPAHGPKWTLPELQEIVGGYIEVVRVFSRHNAIMYVNEEGVIIGLPLNPVASDVAKQPIHGNALLCHPAHLPD